MGCKPRKSLADNLKSKNLKFKSEGIGSEKSYLDVDRNIHLLPVWFENESLQTNE